MKTVLITGANGFIGRNLVHYFANNNWFVLAGVRAGRVINENHENIQRLELDYQDISKLSDTLAPFSIDLVIHAAGVTVAGNTSLYYRGNLDTTQALLDAVKDTKKIILLSSLAAHGPGKKEKDEPISAYGKSKLAAEKCVKGASFSYTIIRPTAVYGPHDQAFLPLLKWAKKGVSIQLGPASRKLTFIHAYDLCRLIFESIEADEKLVYGWDGKIYTQKELMDALRAAVSSKRTLKVYIPSWLFLTVCTGIDIILAKFLKLPWAYPPEKVKELIAEDWSISEKHAPAFPCVHLKEGFSNLI